jgi:hypothetical protein
MSNNKTCLIINFWLGERRRNPDIYDQDRTIYVKKQIEFLTRYQNDIDTIYFTFNIEPEHYHLISEVINLIPKKINNSNVKINIRKNINFSYGAWNEIVKKEIENYDYFIFNEDDYVFVQDKWDEYLINKFNSKNSMGYLGMGVRELHIDIDRKTKLGYGDYKSVRESFHSVGITSKSNIKKILNDKDNLIPTVEIKDYYGEEDHRIEDTQTMWSVQFYKYGMENFDIRNEYKAEFQLTDRNEDVWYLFTWNEDTLIKNFVTILQPGWSWYVCNDYEYQKQNEYI